MSIWLTIAKKHYNCHHCGNPITPGQVIFYAYQEATPANVCRSCGEFLKYDLDFKESKAYKKVVANA